MDADALLTREDCELDAFSRSLPRTVRFLGSPPRREDAARPRSAMCEFEVVSGNAAYREGERFYLTWTQARRAYPKAPDL